MECGTQFVQKNQFHREILAYNGDITITIIYLLLLLWLLPLELFLYHGDIMGYANNFIMVINLIHRWWELDRGNCPQMVEHVILMSYIFSRYMVIADLMTYSQQNYGLCNGYRWKAISGDGHYSWDAVFKIVILQRLCFFGPRCSIIRTKL